MKTRGVQYGNSKRKIFSAFVVFLAVLSISTSTVTQAIYIGSADQNSPRPTAFPDGNFDARHILIWSNHGKSQTLVLKLLYPANRAAGSDDHLTIYDPFPTSTKCTLMDGITVNQQVMRVAANGTWLKQLGTTQDGVLAKQLCNDGADSNYANAKGGIYGTSSVTFVVPAAVIDSAVPDNRLTGMREVNITFQWNPNNDFPAPKNPVAGNSGEATVSFVTRSANGQLSGATTTEGATNNGMVPRQGGADGPMAVQFEFALPCQDQSSGQVVPKTLTLYDLDSDKTGFYVEEIGGSRLTRADYSNFTDRLGASATWNAANNRWQATNNDRVWVRGTINMKANAKYRLVVTGLKHTASVNDLFNNYVYVGVPGDIVYGQSWFTCPGYELKPSIGLVGNTKLERGESYTINGGVSYSGNTAAGNHRWIIRETKTPPGGTSVDRDMLDTISPFPPNQNSSTTLTVPDTDSVGTKYCYQTWVLGWSIYDSGWKPSTSVCVTVGIKPKMQIWGHDARSNGSILSSSSNIDGKTYTSWAEFGTFSKDATAGFLSGAATKDGRLTSSHNATDWTKLTFANQGGEYGKFGSIAAPTDLVHSLKGRCAPMPNGSITNASFDNPSGGKYQIICVNGDATITENIAGTGKFGQQQVIIANNIAINKDVDNINAWLVTTDSSGNVKGNVRTCGDTNPNFKYADCNTRLRVNGAVITENLYAYRTAYDAVNRDTPAEIFNLRGDAFVWIYNGATSDPSIMAQTTSIRELPPRF